MKDTMISNIPIMRSEKTVTMEIEKTVTMEIKG